PIGIDQESAQEDAPGLAILEQPGPLDCGQGDIRQTLSDATTLDVLQLACGQPRMLFRFAIQRAPEQKPKHAETAGEQKNGPPIAETFIDEKNQEWRYRGADARTAVEQRHCPGAFPGGKPLGYRLGGARIGGRFA